MDSQTLVWPLELGCWGEEWELNDKEVAALELQGVTAASPNERKLSLTRTPKKWLRKASTW